jgi:hypothetical protein
MPRDVTLTFDDGTSHVYNNVPENVTPDQVEARAVKDFPQQKIKNIDGGKKAAPTPKPEEKGYVRKYLEGVNDAAGKYAAATAGDGTVIGAVKARAKTALGVGETALGMAGGVAGDIVSASGGEYSALTGSKKPAEWADKIKKVITDITAPRTDAGKAITGAVGAVAKPAGDLMELLPKYLEEHGHDAAAKDLRAVLDVAGGEEAIVGKGTKAAIKDVGAAKVAEIAKKVDTEVPPAQRQAMVDAQKNGFTLEIAKARPNFINRNLQGFFTDKRFKDAASAKNQPIIQEMIRKGLGLKDGVEISPDSLRDVRTQAHLGYEAIRNVSDNVVKPDKGYFANLEAIAKPFAKPAKAVDNTGFAGAAGEAFKKNEPGFARTTTHPVEKLVKDLRNSKEFTTGQALDKISELRETADVAYRAGNNSLGKAAKALANNIEESIGKHLEATGQPPKLLMDFQKSREVIAKSYTIQKALDKKTGLVDARKLAYEMQKSPGKLKDEIETVAKFARDNEAVAVPKAGAPSGLTGTDRVASVVGAATHGIPGALTALGASLAMGAAKSTVSSGLYQRKFAKARTEAEETKARVDRANATRKAARKVVRGTSGAAITAAQMQDEQDKQ